MTAEQLVQRIGAWYGRSDVSTDEAGYVLWERTAFPLAGRSRTIEQINDYFEAGR